MKSKYPAITPDHISIRSYFQLLIHYLIYSLACVNMSKNSFQRKINYALCIMNYASELWRITDSNR